MAGILALSTLVFAPERREAFVEELPVRTRAAAMASSSALIFWCSEGGGALHTENDGGALLNGKQISQRGRHRGAIHRDDAVEASDPRGLRGAPFSDLHDARRVHREDKPKLSTRPSDGDVQ
eukprot:CAMPEP_0195585534 /NCGR_PEP_ID=MMETSP0814-20130614/27683_1 /TAXON_ID=97485 /ORGANISM="Prymnesium parvum, Strain Texoma1" /LENGTH=121 /DNA_ID=CAMNT_0040723849 /DNA_START=319 /DNA_END=680 /DNA_ORIENTATION=+